MRALVWLHGGGSGGLSGYCWPVSAWLQSATVLRMDGRWRLGDAADGSEEVVNQFVVSATTRIYAALPRAANTEPCIESRRLVVVSIGSSKMLSRIPKLSAAYHPK